MNTKEKYKMINYILWLLTKSNLVSDNMYVRESLHVVYAGNGLKNTYVGYNKDSLILFSTYKHLFEGELLHEIEQNAIIDACEDLKTFVRIPVNKSLISYVQEMIKDLVAHKEIKESVNDHILKLQANTAVLISSISEGDYQWQTT